MSNKAYVAGQGLVVRHFQELLNLIHQLCGILAGH
jgi:hypothetical protein